MAGIKELSDVVKFVGTLVSSVAEAAADGKGTIGDVAHVVPVLYSLPSAIDGLDEAVVEAKDLSADELSELAVVVKDALDLPDDKVESAVEELVDIALKLYGVVAKLKA
jgi:hypothetical protein